MKASIFTIFLLLNCLLIVHRVNCSVAGYVLGYMLRNPSANLANNQPASADLLINDQPNLNRTKINRIRSEIGKDCRKKNLSNNHRDPQGWTVDDVINYLNKTDSSLNVYADLFREHEIDGKAFLLLTSDVMMKYMSLKLGPAIKITSIIERLKNLKKASHSAC